MAEIDSSTTIIVLEAVSPDAIVGLQLPHNSERLVLDHFDSSISSFPEPVDNASRECTPYVSRPSKHKLHLKFKPKPKDSTKGFVFGSNPSLCDVLLDNGRSRGVSSQQFSIGFNWDSGFLILTNLSRNGTTLEGFSYGTSPLKLKAQDKRMLNPSESTKVYVGTLEFELHIPNRSKHEQAQYDRNWEIYRTRFRNAVPKLLHLILNPSLETTPLIMRRRGLEIPYILQEEIGRGSYATIYKASESRTGDLYAVKVFAAHVPEWNLQAQVEIKILRENPHEHIVNFVDDDLDRGGNTLVMEYMPLGNLRKLTKIKNLSSVETKLVLHQTLQVLVFLHSRDITHRDVKPENILVLSRYPELFIKLSDFGKSGQKDILETFCGSEGYVAPEICTGSYTKSVDIWAVGFLGYEFIRGLPIFSQKTRALLPKKVHSKITQINHHECDLLVKLLNKMLEVEPKDRPSARDCLAVPEVWSSLSPLQSSNGRPITRQYSRRISEEPTDILDAPKQIRAELVGTVQVSTPLGRRKRLPMAVSPQMRSQKRVLRGTSAVKHLNSDATAVSVQDCPKFHDSGRAMKESKYEPCGLLQLGPVIN